MAAITPISDSPSTIVSKLGTLAAVSDGGTITISGNISIDIQSQGAIEGKVGVNNKGGNINIIDVTELKCKNGPLFKLTDSNLVVTSVDTLKSNTGSILEIEGKTTTARAIISRVKNMSSTKSCIQTEGKCKVLVDNIGSILCNEPTFLLASSSLVTSAIGGGSITIQNINTIPSGIKVYDHDLIIRNVKSISSSGAGVYFTCSTSPKDKTGVYTFSASDVGIIRGTTYAVRTENASVNLNGVNCIGPNTFNDSDVVATNCTFGGKLELTDCFFEGRRLKTLAVETLRTAAKFYSSVVSGTLITTKSAVETYNSTLLTNTHTSSSISVHKSALAGNTTLNIGSSLLSFSSDLTNVTNNNSFTGLYGLPSGTITTTGKGMTFSGGTSGQSVDGKSISNGISTPASTFYLTANAVDFESIVDMVFTAGQDFSLDTVGNTTLTVGGDYELAATGSVTQSGTTVDWTQSGAISITSSSTVTLTGTTVTV